MKCTTFVRLAMSASLLTLLAYASITYTDSPDGSDASSEAVPLVSTPEPTSESPVIETPEPAPVIEPVIEPEPVVEPVVPPEETPAVVETRVVYPSDDEMLAYIITRESHGDPYATNGKYKGIGQLDESYYPTCVGLTWEECEGNYDIQLQAMLGYIASRYGSIQGAYEFWQWNGWY